MTDSDKRVMLYMDRYEEDERRHLELLAATLAAGTSRGNSGGADTAACVRVARAIQAEVRRTSGGEASDD